MPKEQKDEDKFGFAKLQGKDFMYYVKKYEVSFGRKSKSKGADFCLGNNLNMSRQHARLQYSFERGQWEMEVIGKNGIFVNGELVTPDKSPAVLTSQQLIAMGDVKFYFLLPKGGGKHGGQLNGAGSGGAGAEGTKDECRKGVVGSGVARGSGGGERAKTEDEGIGVTALAVPAAVPTPPTLPPIIELNASGPPAPEPPPVVEAKTHPPGAPPVAASPLPPPTLPPPVSLPKPLPLPKGIPLSGVGVPANGPSQPTGVAAPGGNVEVVGRADGAAVDVEMDDADEFVVAPAGGAGHRGSDHEMTTEGATDNRAQGFATQIL